MNFREYLKETQLNERMVWVDLNDSFVHEYKDKSIDNEFDIKFGEGNGTEKKFAHALAKNLIDGKKLPASYAAYTESPIDYKSGKEQTLTFMTARNKNGRLGVSINVTFSEDKGRHEWTIAQTSGR